MREKPDSDRQTESREMGRRRKKKKKKKKGVFTKRPRDAIANFFTKRDAISIFFTKRDAKPG